MKYEFNFDILFSGTSVLQRVKYLFLSSPLSKPPAGLPQVLTNPQYREVHVVESSWNVMAHSDAREGKWRGKWRMEWVASSLHTTSEHGVSSITTAGAHTSAASSRLNWRPCRFKWTRSIRRKTKSGFCACAITFQTQSTNRESGSNTRRWITVCDWVRQNHQPL